MTTGTDDRRLEILASAVTRPKLTVTHARVTLKVPTDALHTEVEALRRFALAVAALIPRATPSLRGRIEPCRSGDEYVRLSSDARDRAYAFKSTADGVVPVVKGDR